MLVKFFDRGHVKKHHSLGGDGAKNYLLSPERVANGTAVLLRGNAEITTEVINSYESQGQIYTAGCLSFDSEESAKITEEEQHEIMQSFENALFPEMSKNHFSGYWVRHTDKVDPTTKKMRLELNFVYANVDLISGNALTVYYTNIDNKRIDAWKDWTNFRYGLSDPNDPKRRQAFVIDRKQPLPNRVLQQQISEHLQQKIIDGSILNHEQIKQAIQSLGLEIVPLKRDRNQINIKNPYDETAANSIPLKGFIYEKEFERERFISEHHAQRDADPRSEYYAKRERAKRARRTYETELTKRAERLRKRFRESYATSSIDDHQLQQIGEPIRAIISETESAGNDKPKQKPFLKPAERNNNRNTKAADATSTARADNDPVLSTARDEHPDKNKPIREPFNPRKQSTIYRFNQGSSTAKFVNFAPKIVIKSVGFSTFTFQYYFDNHTYPGGDSRLSKQRNQVNLFTNLDGDHRDQFNNNIQATTKRQINEQPKRRSALQIISETLRETVQRITHQIHQPLYAFYQRIGGIIGGRKRNYFKVRRAESATDQAKRRTDEAYSNANLVESRIQDSKRRTTATNSKLSCYSDQAGEINRTLESIIEKYELKKQAIELEKQQKALKEQAKNQLDSNKTLNVEPNSVLNQRLENELVPDLEVDKLALKQPKLQPKPEIPLSDKNQGLAKKEPEKVVIPSRPKPR